MSWGIKRGTGEENEGQRALYREYILKNEINYYLKMKKIHSTITIILNRIGRSALSGKFVSRKVWEHVNADHF